MIEDDHKRGLLFIISLLLLMIVRSAQQVEEGTAGLAYLLPVNRVRRRQGSSQFTYRASRAHEMKSERPRWSACALCMRWLDVFLPHAQVARASQDMYARATARGVDYGSRPSVHICPVRHQPSPSLTLHHHVPNKTFINLAPL